ncbi:hypothetical protein VPH35_103807 [Triticum aestivum]
MCLVKPLLLALNAIRFFIIFHVADGSSKLNWLLETLSTCRGRSVVIEDGSSCSIPFSRLKLTSRAMMLLEDMSSSGRPLEKELCERLTCSKPVRSARDGEMRPSSPLDAREISVTAPSPLQACEVGERWRDAPFKSFRCQGDLSDGPISIANDAFPLAAVCLMVPRRGEGAISRRPSEELEKCFSCSVHEVAGERPESSRNSCSTAGGMVKERIEMMETVAALTELQ